MNTVFISSLLAPSQVWGGIAFLLLFIVCFILVHAVKLSSLGYKVLHETPPDPPPQEIKKTPPKPPVKRKKRTRTATPVYYLVEKKRVKSPPKEEYAAPKRIRFAKNATADEDEEDFV